MTEALRKLCLAGLAAYLAPLALAQTVLGAPFMPLRWAGLATAFVLAAAAWLGARRRQVGFDAAGAALAAYLLLTAASLPGAENPQFSVLRWGSHAVMLVTLFYLLRQCLTAAHVARVVGALKLVLGVVVVSSVLHPAREPAAGDLTLYRGILGDANSLGHLAAIATLLYVHGAVSAPGGRVGQLHWLAAFVAALLVWHSGARSSAAALVFGLGLLHLHYPRALRGKGLLAVVALLGAMLLVPGAPREVERFVAKTPGADAVDVGVILKSRRSPWERSWHGFTERPLLGWGFGGHEGIPSRWHGGLTAVGFVSRDLVNDTLFVLESSGLVGGAGFALLAWTVAGLGPRRGERRRVGPELRPLVDLWTLNWVLAATLLVLFQLDDTGLSAGNLPSAILWLAAGGAGALANEVRLARRRQRAVGLVAWPSPAPRGAR